MSDRSPVAWSSRTLTARMHNTQIPRLAAETMRGPQKVLVARHALSNYSSAPAAALRNKVDELCLGLG